MIALTQEKRQKRINWLNARISSMEEARDEMPFGLSEDESMELSAYKDSLLSLTAEPVTWWTGPEPTDCGIREEIHDHESGCHQIPLYTAPPVPRINTGSKLSWNDAFKLLDVNACGEDRITAFMMGAEWRLSEIKRLNGFGE